MLLPHEQTHIFFKHDKAAFKVAAAGALFLFFVYGLAIGGAALATSSQKLSLEQLVQEADLVVKARVQEVRSQESTNRFNVTTLVILAVDEEWKGPKISQVVLKQPGGSAGEITQRVVGLSEFSLGEDVILFLKKQPDGYYAPVGGRQGKFTIKTDPQSNKPIIEDLTGARQELEDFLRQLRQIVGK